VKCELRIVSGARAGHRDVFDKSYIGIGRHPLSDLRFDAEQDLDASTRHAAIVRTGDAFVLRDLGSTNGTFVNGERLSAERPLHDGDALRFGVHGPEVSFHLLREEEEVVMRAVQAPKPAAAPPGTGAAAAGPRPGAAPPKPKPRPGTGPDDRTTPTPRAAAPPSRTAVLRAEVSAHRSRARALLVTLGVIVIGALAVVYWQGKTTGDVIAGQQHQVDSLAAQVAALQRLQQQADSAKAALESQLRAERDPARLAQLRTQLAQATQRSDAIEQARGVDYRAIQNRNDSAIAVIYVRFADTTRMWTGTAFSVTRGGRMLTNKHVVLNGDERPRDIAIQFSGSADVHPARLERVSPDADLAVVQLESEGPFPVIAGFADTPAAVGAPIALIGFPGGGGATVQAKLVSGSVTRVVPDSLYEVDAFSGTGASGSPIFDRDGKVIGIEFGGLAGSGGTAIVGLPIARARALLGN